MMAGCSSWCKETDEKINYTKICRLMVDGGTEALRSVFDGTHPPSSLTAILNTKKTTLQKLKKPKGKVLNNEQWDKLYPPSGSNPKSEDFDITLLFVLLRNICGLKPPTTGWDDLPPISDNSLEANLARIKYYRNNTIAHKPNTEINDVDFEQYWQDISSTLLPLGLSQEDIDDLKLASLGEKDYNQLLYDWYISDEDIKTQLEDLKSNTTDIKSDTTGIKLDTALLHGIKNDISEIKTIYRKTYEQNRQIDKLAKDEFGKLIESLCKFYHPGTRKWILDQIQSYVDSHQLETCAMQITAGPGMGKSIIAAKICEMYKDLGCLGGCHFFQFSNSIRNNPRLMLQSLARQMCDTVPGYGDALESKLQTNFGKNLLGLKCEELFTVLFEEPFHKLKCSDSKFVIVLDAIDECCSEMKYELQEILRNKIPFLPSWIRCVFTTRPSFSALPHQKSIDIKPNDPQNKRDLSIFLNAKLEQLYGDVEDYSSVAEELFKMSKGLFLVAYFVINYLQEQKITTPSKVMVIFMHGLSSVYERYFGRIKEEILPYISEEERFYKMLEAIVASKDPLPICLVYNILDVKSERAVPRSERKKRRDALNSLHSLFPVENDHVKAFHKSVVDWLILQGDEEHEFSVRVEDGNEVLANQCYDALSDIRNGEKDLDKPLDLTDSEKYALRFGKSQRDHGGSTTSFQQKKSEILKNYFILGALLWYEPDNEPGVIDTFTIPGYSDKINRIYLYGKFSVLNIVLYDLEESQSLKSYHVSKFRHCVEFFLHAANKMNVSEEEMTPKPIDLLNMYNLSYFSTEIIGIDLIQEENQLPMFGVSVLVCENGFFLFQRSGTNTVVQKRQLDGTCSIMKSFPRVSKMCVSSDHRFITKLDEKGDTEVLDVSTLELLTSQSLGVTRSCQMFDDQPSFVDSKSFVIEISKGEVQKWVTTKKGFVAIAVSNSGHCLLASDEELNFSKNDEVHHRKLYLIHPKINKEFPKAIDCSYTTAFDAGVKFSKDGLLLAYQWNTSIIIINTMKLFIV